jgi:hypothetical protein
MDNPVEDTNSLKNEIYAKMQGITNYNVFYDFIIIQKIPHTENKNGLFINLSLLDRDKILKLKKLLTTIENEEMELDNETIHKELNFYKESMKKPSSNEQLQKKSKYSKSSQSKQYKQCKLSQLQKEIISFSYH